MAIKLTNGFTVIPEGWHVFKIVDVKHDEDFGKLEVFMETSNGMKHRERFSLLNQAGEPNEGAMNAFSFFAKCALNDFARDEVEASDLIGHFIRGNITHTKLPSKKDPTKMSTFANIGDKEPASGFEGASVSGDALSALLD